MRGRLALAIGEGGQPAIMEQRQNCCCLESVRSPFHGRLQPKFVAVEGTLSWTSFSLSAARYVDCAYSHIIPGQWGCVPVNLPRAINGLSPLAAHGAHRLSKTQRLFSCFCQRRHPRDLGTFGSAISDRSPAAEPLLYGPLQRCQRSSWPCTFGTA